jgi:hypothetical protein
LAAPTADGLDVYRADALEALTCPLGPLPIRHGGVGDGTLAAVDDSQKRSSVGCSHEAVSSWLTGPGAATSRPLLIWVSAILRGLLGVVHDAAAAFEAFDGVEPVAIPTPKAHDGQLALTGEPPDTRLGNLPPRSYVVRGQEMRVI